MGRRPMRQFASQAAFSSGRSSASKRSTPTACATCAAGNSADARPSINAGEGVPTASVNAQT